MPSICQSRKRAKVMRWRKQVSKRPSARSRGISVSRIYHAVAIPYCGERNDLVHLNLLYFQPLNPSYCPKEISMNRRLVLLIAVFFLLVSWFIKFRQYLRTWFVRPCSQPHGVYRKRKHNNYTVGVIHFHQKNNITLLSVSVITA